LEKNHDLNCHGKRYRGVLDLPAELKRAKSVSASKYYSCASRYEDGKVFCWGEPGNSSGPTESLPPSKAVSVARNFACSLSDDGKVDCWNTVGEGSRVEVPNDIGNVLQITGGGYHMCALRDDFTVTCFQDEGVPWPLRPDDRTTFEPWKNGDFVALTSGYNFTCGQHLDGKIDCWGEGIAANSSIGSRSLVYYFPNPETKPKWHRHGGVIGSRVRLLRKQNLRISQFELAKRLKVNRGTVSQIENGKLPVGMNLAKPLGKVFGYSYRMFLSSRYNF
jgi:DNA-binding XRE family transcriptional regulator